jgi:putative YhbY family RNA-binding protein
MLDITAEQRRALRARAHALNPVVAISQNGLSESVLNEIARSLESHELIKIRVFNDEREVREQFLATICEQLGAAPVQHIGKLLVIWRPMPESKVLKPRSSRTEPRRSKRSFQGGTRD